MKLHPLSSRTSSSGFVLFVADVREEKEGRIEEGRIEEGRIEEGRVEEGRPEEGRIEEGRIEEGRIEEGRDAEKSSCQESTSSRVARRHGRIVEAQGDGAIEASSLAQATRLQMSDNARSPR